MFLSRRNTPILLSFLVCALIATSMPGRAQVKLARVSGAPGMFGLGTSTIFDSSGSLGYVSNPGSGLVQKFRTLTGEVLGSVALDPGVGPLALSPSDTTLAVLGVTSQKLTLVATDTMSVIIESTYASTGFSERSGMSFSLDEIQLYISDSGANSVLVVSTADASLFRRIPVGEGPHIMTPLPTPGEVVVFCSGAIGGAPASMYIIDTLSAGVTDFFVIAGSVGAAFNNVAFADNGNILIAPLFGADRIAVYDLRSRLLGSRSSEGKGPSKVVSSADGRRLAVMNSTSQEIAILRLPEALPEGEINIEDLDFIGDSIPVFSSDSRLLFIPSYGTGEVIVFDLESMSEKNRIFVGMQPSVLTLNEPGGVIASLDLGSNEVSLIALEPRSIYIPHLTQDASNYSGLAASNFGVDAGNISFIARGNAGGLLPGATNPLLLTVPAGQNVALTVAQVFGFDPQDVLDGWIEAYALGDDISVLYLTGTISQSQLDGFLAKTEVSKRLGFSRITEQVERFGDETSTEIIVVNPNADVAQLTFRLYAETLEGPGRLLNHVARTLGPRSRLRSLVSDVMNGVVYPKEGAYLELTSTLPVQGLAVVRQGDSLAMIPARPRGLPGTSFFSVQYATGGAGLLDTPISSHLSVCNTSPGPVTVTALVEDDDAEIIPAGAQPLVKTLQPYETLFGGPEELFGFPDPVTDPDLHVGSLTLTADAPGIIADLLFGDAANGRYLTPYSLQDTTGTEFKFTHFAQGVFGNPPRSLFTGIAIYNPSGQLVEIEIEANSPTGELLGSTKVRLESGNRLSRTLPELIPSIQQQNGGTICITSGFPISVFQVFGSDDSDFMVAIPPLVKP